MTSYTRAPAETVTIEEVHAKFEACTSNWQRKPAARSKVYTSPANRAKQEHTDTMSEMNREELKARLGENEAKVDLRLKEFEAASERNISAINHRFDLIDQQLSAFSGLKTTVITTAIASTLAIAAVLVGLLSYGVSERSAGENGAQLLHEARQQALENRQLLEKLSLQINLQAPAATQAPISEPAPAAASGPPAAQQ